MKPGIEPAEALYAQLTAENAGNEAVARAPESLMAVGRALPGGQHPPRFPLGPVGRHGHLQINAQNCLHCKTCDIKDRT